MAHADHHTFHHFGLPLRIRQFILIFWDDYANSSFHELCLTKILCQSQLSVSSWEYSSENIDASRSYSTTSSHKTRSISGRSGSGSGSEVYSSVANSSLSSYSRLIKGSHPLPFQLPWLPREVQYVNEQTIRALPGSKKQMKSKIQILEDIMVTGIHADDIQLSINWEIACPDDNNPDRIECLIGLKFHHDRHSFLREAIERNTKVQLKTFFAKYRTHVVNHFASTKVTPEDSSFRVIGSLFGESSIEDSEEERIVGAKNSRSSSFGALSRAVSLVVGESNSLKIHPSSSSSGRLSSSFYPTRRNSPISTAISNTPFKLQYGMLNEREEDFFDTFESHRMSSMDEEKDKAERDGEIKASCQIDPVKETSNPEEQLGSLSESDEDKGICRQLLELSIPDVFILLNAVFQHNLKLSDLIEALNHRMGRISFILLLSAVFHSQWASENARSFSWLSSSIDLSPMRLEELFMIGIYGFAMWVIIEETFGLIAAAINTIQNRKKLIRK